MTRKLSVISRASSLAIAAALTAGAVAQSFQGTPNVSSGDAFISEGVGTTDVFLNTVQTVIDWTPDDNLVGNFGAINFQPGGTTATFSSFQDFAVLNRINVADPTRLVFMDGTINSFVSESVGGSVFFYSPSGFVIGSNAVINVGSLVLSASPIAVDGNGNFINAGTVTFNQAVNSNAPINIVSGAQIGANGSGSYVALVAPQIWHQGTIRTDGAAALVAAEAATITFSPDGLFNIEVTTGTDADTGIHVDGGTIGRNDPTEGIYNHRAYLVAVAKNDAVTMLINNGGSVGFDTATSATIENNVVVLSGGYDVLAGDHFTTSGVSNVPLTITNASFSSDVDAQVTGGAAIHSGDGALTFDGDLSIIGGETTTTGGNVLIDGSNGNPLSIAGDLYARAFRRNADGSQTGLITRLGAEGGSTVTIGGNVTLDSDSFGATPEEFGENGTNAIGGNAQVNIGANSTLNVIGSVDIHADGYGGHNFAGGGAGGMGIGGQVFLMSINGGATVNIGGPVYVSAQGFGGSAGECSICGVTGGLGLGGNATVHTGGGTNQMALDSDVTITVAGHGGAGDAQAGIGRGGTANLGAFDGSTLAIGADTQIDANGYGGFGFDNAGGLGRGGEARIGTNTGGSIELAGPVFVTADGEGGSGGTGGTGTGGRAYISAFNGTIHALSDVFVSASSFGGSSFFLGGNGGDGLANTDLNDPMHTWASLSAEAGSLTVDGLSAVVANATGGNGSNGGNGGDAVAGRATVHAGNSNAGASLVDLGDLVVSAEASGGTGGDGQGGTDGGNGGDGGAATGGRAIATAAAGNGELVVNVATISASAVGGDGGNGGGGDGGAGGNGGDGGTATGGFINVGTESGTDAATASNDGSATFTTIFAVASASGGNGGDAGFGSPDGLAGNGGDALGGQSTLLVRGSTLDVGNVFLDASAFGGSGGLDTSENQAGLGGDAFTGFVGVLATNRFLIPGQRGALNAAAITGTALATGGSGATSGGQWTTGGGVFFEVINSDVTVDSVNLAVGADGIDPDATETFASSVAVINGDVDVANGFNIQTPGRISVHADNGTLSAASFSASADTFVHDETRPLPASVGTISADTISLGTNGDLIVDAHLVSTGPLGLFAPGLVDIEDASSDSFIGGGAGSSFTAGNMSAADHISLSANETVDLGSVDAGSYINIFSFGGDILSGSVSAGDFIILDGATGIFTGDLTAVNDIQAVSNGDISVGDATSTAGSIFLTAGGGITAGNLAALFDIELDAIGDIDFGDSDSDELDFDAGGAVTGGNIIAGTFATGEAQGAVSFGDISVGIQREGGPSEDGFAVGIVSATSINVGNVEADEAIGFASLGALTTGNLDAGTGVMALVSGNMSFGSITTAPDGQVYLADAQMFLDAGGPDDFDPLLVLGSQPLATSGSISINGPLSTGLLQAAAGTNFTAQAVTAPFGVQVSAGGLITVGGAWNVGDASLTSSDIDIGASGSITAGDIELVSVNSTRTVIGDGTGLAGYNLSSAEYNRLSANDINVVADTALGAAANMVIGDLSVAVPGGGEGIEYDFSVWNSETEVGEGSIRIVGDMLFTGMGTSDVIDFTTGRFELDAETGQLSLTGAGGALAGTVEIYATHIHVASGTILDQLAANPQYAGYQDDLNAPATVQRPEGVLRAGSVAIEFGSAQPGELYTLYVQNTGTQQTPAGFAVSGDVLFSEGSEQSFAPGSIDVVINGQIVTPGGTLTGVDVRDALVEAEGDLTPFTANSTINGCPLVGSCIATGPFPPEFTPTPGIQDVITLIGDNQPPPPDFGNEDIIDDNDEETEDSATSPIVPPDPLFDTSELGDAGGTVAPDVGTSMRSTPGLTEEGDVDDPVSGSGNPALMETSPPPTDEEQQP